MSPKLKNQVDIKARKQWIGLIWKICREYILNRKYILFASIYGTSTIDCVLGHKENINNSKK